MVELILAIGVAGFGYVKSRKFVRERLRFVDAVHKPAAPVIAGVGTALAIGAVVSLPFVPFGAAMAVITGVGIGAGVSRGAKDSKRLPAP